MKKQHRFLVSYICDNQPNSMEVSSDKDSLPQGEAEEYIKLAHPQANAKISDVRIVGLHRTNNPDVHPGHYQQPEG